MKKMTQKTMKLIMINLKIKTGDINQSMDGKEK